MSLKKKIVILVLLVIGGLATYRGGQFVHRKFFTEAEVEDKKVPVKAVAVGTRDLSDVLKITGNIIGKEVVKVFPPVQGKIMQILTREGQAVGYKQVLFTIDRDVVGMEYKPAIVESPISGFVGEIYVDRGMTVSMSTPLAQVVNMDTVEAVINLMEEDINRVQLGMAAKIRVSAYPDRVFNGTVYKKSAVLNQASRTQETRIALANPGLTLRHGMFADIEIVTKVRKSALSVPVDAVFEDKQGHTCVYRVINDRAEKTEITTGMSVREYYEVLTGLNPGDVVVTLGHENVSDGDFLKVSREDAEAVAAAEEKKASEADMAAKKEAVKKDGE